MCTYFLKTANILREKEKKNNQGLAMCRKKNLKEYLFLTWLSPYVQPRKTNSNLPDDQTKWDDRFDDESELGESESVYTDEDGDGQIEALTPPVAKPQKGQKTSVEKKNKDESGCAAKRYKQTDLIESDLEMMQSMSKVMNCRLEKSKPLPAAESLSTDEIFGKMIATELKQLPDHIKIRVKHEFNNLLFRYQMQAESEVIQTFSPPMTPSPQFDLKLRNTKQKRGTSFYPGLSEWKLDELFK